MTRRLIALFLALIAAASVSLAQVRVSRVRVAESVMEDQLVKTVPPAYPPQALHAKVQGKVELQVTISKSGNVENVQLISGHPILASAAIDAVRQWQYKPYLLNGMPVEVETKVHVNFTLSDQPSADGAAMNNPDKAVSEESGGAVDRGTRLGPPTQRIRVAENVENGLIVKKVPPEYPLDAKTGHVQGTVMLKMIVAKDGSVANLEVLSGHPMLIPSAVDAVRQWQYKPFLLNSEPVEVETQVHITYTLAD